MKKDKETRPVHFPNASFGKAATKVKNKPKPKSERGAKTDTQARAKTVEGQPTFKVKGSEGSYLAEAADQLAAFLLDQATESIVICDERGRIVRTSHAAHRFCLGRILGKPFEEAFRLRMAQDKSPLKPKWFSIYDVLKGKTFRGCAVSLEQNGKVHHFLLSAKPLVAGGFVVGGVVFMVDITEHKGTEEALRRSRERFEVLSETAARLLATDKPQQVVNDLCQKVMEHLDCHAFFNYLVDKDGQCLRLNAYAGIPEEVGKEIDRRDYGVTVCGCAARDGCRIVAENIPETLDPRTDLVRSFGIKAYACHPLFSQGRVIGTLSFGTRSRLTFTEDELALMKTVADHVAIAMDRVRQHEELEKRVCEPTAELVTANEQLKEKAELLDLAHDTIFVRDLVTDRIAATNALLSLFARKGSRKDYLDSVVELLHGWTGCRCIGIRVRDRNGLIPYDSFLGFSKEFWESENWISVEKDHCICSMVFRQNPGPGELRFMTREGSFYCNNTTNFVDELSREEREGLRGVCMKAGYSSLAVIPVSYQKRILGTIHLADESHDKVPLEVVQFIESLAPLIGEALNRFNLEETLRESEKHLKVLSSQLISVQEEERKRIAQELHDSIGQILSALKFGIEDAANKVGQQGKGTYARSLEALVPLVRNAVHETRRISTELWPSILEDLGILPTINWLCREFQKVYERIGIETEIDLEETDVSRPLKTVIYRVLQEVLNNIAKHSSADRVRLFLGKGDGTIRLVIEDNGKGFDAASALAPDNPNRGFGLRSVKERIELLRGVLTIESKEGRGTTIRAAWPE